MVLPRNGDQAAAAAGQTVQVGLEVGDDAAQHHVRIVDTKTDDRLPDRCGLTSTGTYRRNCPAARRLSRSSRVLPRNRSRSSTRVSGEPAPATMAAPFPFRILISARVG